MGAIFDILQPILFAVIAVILLAGALISSNFSFGKFIMAMKSPFKTQHLKILVPPVAALIAASLSFIGFFSDPATKTETDEIKANIEEVQTDIAASQKLLLAEMEKLKASLSIDETKSFEASVENILSTNDARKVPARDALKAGRIEEAGDKLLKIARQEQAASEDMARATQNSFREVGALFYPINTAKSLEGYQGAIDAGSTKAWDYIYAARLFVRIGNIGEAEKTLNATEALTLSQHDQGIVLNELGDISIKRGDLSTALDYFEQGVEIRKILAQVDPTDAVYQRHLSVSYERLGDVSVSSGDLSTAQSYFEQSLEIRKILTKDDPSNEEFQLDLSVSYNRLGDVSVSSGDLASARNYYQASLEVSKSLAIKDLSIAEHQRSLSMSYIRLGDVSVSSGDLPAALGYFEQDLEIAKVLAGDDPSNAHYQRDLSVSYERLGDVSKVSHDLTAARGHYESSLDIRKRLAKVDVSNAEYQRDLIFSFSKMAAVDTPSALSWWRQAKVICDAMVVKGQLAPKDEFFPKYIERKIAALEAQ